MKECSLSSKENTDLPATKTFDLASNLSEHLHKFIVFDDEDDRVKKRGKVIVSPLRIFVVTGFRHLNFGSTLQKRKQFLR